MKSRRLKANRFRTSRLARRSPRPLAAHRFELLEARQLLAGDIQFRFEFTDVAQNPVDAVQVGDSFLLRTFVQDIRAVPQGVSSAYMDFVYDNPYAMSSGAAIVHGADYATETSGDAAMFPRIEDVGGGLTGGIAPANPDQEFLLFSLPLVAMSAGTFSFHPEMADGFGRDILLVGSGTPLPFDPENVMLVGDSTLQILPTISFQQSTSFVDEGAGTHTVNVQLDTGGAVLAAPVTVMVSALPSSTAGGGDFTLDTSSVTFAAGSMGGTQPVSLTIIPDAASDGNLNVDLGLSVASDAAAGLGHLDRHRAKIIDDDFARVEVEVNLYADHNGLPGVILTDDTITAGNRFFVELVVGDYRDDPAAPGEQRGVIGMRVNQFAWPSANLVTLDEFPVDNPLNLVSPNPLVTSAFPLSRSGNLTTLSPTMQAIQNLTGFSNPTGGEGTAIGINQPARFSLMHFVANQPVSPAVALTLNVDTATITLADNSAVAATLVSPVAVVVNSRPTALNNHFGVNFNSSNNLLNVLGNDTDPDADNLTITSVTASAAGATIAIVGTPGTPGHQVQYTPPAGFRGTDTFIYTIDDAQQLSCATAMVTVDVGPLRVEKATNAANPAAPTAAEDADSPTGPVLALGTDVVWTYQVFNEGTRPLTLTGIVDDFGTPLDMGDDFTPAAVQSGGFNVGDANQNNLLDPGEQWRFTSQGVVSYQVVAGQYSNLAVATATAPDNGDTLSGQDPSNHLGADAQATLVKRTNGDDANTAPGPFLPVGSSAMFTYEVSNTGSVPLDLVQLSDNNGTPGDTLDDFDPAPVETGGFNNGDTNQNGLLDPGETWLFSATRDPVTAGQYTNTATLTANPVDAAGNDVPGLADVVELDSSNHFGVLLGPEHLTLVKQTNGDDADNPIGPLLEVGTTANFSYEVTLAAPANVPVAISSLVDDNGTPGNLLDDFSPAPVETGGFNDGDTNQNGLLDAGETWLFAASRVVTPGQYTNQAVLTVTPVDPAGNDIPGFNDLTATDPSNHFGFTTDVQLEKLTNGQDADTPPGPLLAVGSTATFTYQVSTNGNLPLQIQTLVDDAGTPGNAVDEFSPAPVLSGGFNTGDLNQNSLLDPGEIWLFTAERIVTAGQYTNTAEVTATPRDPLGATIPGVQNVTDSDQSNHEGNPLRVEKATNAADPANPTAAEDADLPPGLFLAPGTTVVWTYLVSNDGAEPLELQSLVDDFGTPGNPGDDFTPAAVESAGFNVGDTNQNDLIDQGESWQFTSQGVVVYQVMLGQYTNIVSATASVPMTGGSASDTDASNHFGGIADIGLTKRTNGQDADTPTGPFLLVGSTATFTYEVTNPGNVPLQLTSIVDDNGTPGDAGDDFSPAAVEAGGFNAGDTNQNGLVDPGETWQFSATRVVTAGQYTNSASVSGTPVDQLGAPLVGFDVQTDTDPSNHFGVLLSPQDLVIEKLTNGVAADDPTGPLLAVGATATFTYQVSLAAGVNIPLDLVSLIDDNGTPGDTNDDFQPAPLETGGFNDGDTNQNGLLDAGETWLFADSRMVTAGQYTNTAVVTANPVDAQGNRIVTLDPLTQQDASNHFGVLAVVELEKQTNQQDADTPPGPILPIGSTATFTYLVSNGGNVPLEFVSLTDDNGTPGDMGDDFSPAPVLSGGFNIGDTNQNNRIDLDETWQFTASRVVTPGQYANVGTVVAHPVDEQGNDIPGIVDVSAQDASHHVGNPIRLEKATNAANPANPTAAEDADTAPGVFLPVGTSVVWTYLVFNDGTEPLDITSLVDDFGTPGDAGDDFSPAPVESGGFNVGDTNQDRLLDPGEAWQFTSSGVVNYLAIAGQYTNSAEVTADRALTGGAVSASDPSNHFGAQIDVDDLVLEKLTDGQDADNPMGPLLEAGTTVVFTYELSLLNSANVPVSVNQLIDDNGTPGDTGDDFNPTPVQTGGFNNGDTNQNGLLDPGETWLFQAMRTVTPGQYTNTATVEVQATSFAGQPIAGIDDLSATDPSNHFGIDAQVALTKRTNGQDADAAPGPFIAVGGTATFSYEVSNPGNVPLQFVALTDDNGTPGNTADDFNPAPLETGGFNNGDTNQNGRIDPGETWLYQAMRTVTAGQYTNMAVVVVNPLDTQGGDLPTIDNRTASDVSNHFGAQGAVQLVKLTQNQDANTPPGAVVPVGSAVTFRYEVSIPAGGNVPLVILQLIDDNGTPGNPGDDFSPTPLESGGFNQGDTNQNGRLDLTETWLFQATRNPVTVGQYTNSATVTANPVDMQGNDIAGLTDVTDADTSNHFGAVADGIIVQKLTNGQDADTAPGPFLPVGGTATFTYEVSLPASVNVPVNIIALTDDNGTPANPADDFTPAGVDDVADGFNDGDTNQNGFVDPGETWLFRATRTVTSGQYTNTVLVTGNPVDFDGDDIPGMDNVTDSDSSNHFGAVVGGIAIEKSTNGQDADTAPGPVIAVGGTASFSYQVSLAAGANVPVEITAIVDDNGTPGNTADDFNPSPVETGGFNNGDTNQNDLLDPGETWLFQASRTVTAGQFTNIGRVTGNPVDPQGNDIAGLPDVTDTDPSNHFGGQLPAIQLRKLTNGMDVAAPPGPDLVEGTTATFTYEVSIPAPGNVPVTIVSLTDDNGTPGVPGDDITPTPVQQNGFNVGDTNQNNLLDPGETWQFQATRTVTLGAYTNIASVTVNPVDFAGDDVPGLEDRSATDSSSHTGILANSSLAGSAYIDANNNGMRDNLPGGGLELGLPDVRIVLLNQAGMIVAETRTDDSGNFNFEMIAPGTYDLVQSQPIAFIDGMTTAGSLGGTSGENIISQITVPADADGTAYLFGEQGIQPQFISKRMFLASSPPILETLRMLVGAGETPINAPMAAGGGEGESSARLAGLLSGSEAGEGESLLNAEDFASRWSGEGEAASRALAPVPLGASAGTTLDEVAADSASPRTIATQYDVALASMSRSLAGDRTASQAAWEFESGRSDQLAPALDQVFDPDADWLL